MVPAIIYAEKYHHLKLVFTSAIALLGISVISLGYLHNNLWIIFGILSLFFSAFNLLEATLPSLISKMAPVEGKGTAMGIYSSAQFLGAFLGGVVGGWLHHYTSLEMVFLSSGLLAGLWFILAATMQPPRYLSNHLLNIGVIDKQKASQLTNCLKQVPGVAEVVVILEEGVAYLKVDRQLLDTTALAKCSVTHGLS